MYLSIYRYVIYIGVALLLLFPTYAFASILKNQTTIDAFYLAREGEPLWIKRTKLNKAGKSLLNVLEQSWQNGLPPSVYHIDKIAQIQSENRRLTKDQALEIELLLTDGYINYVRDLSGMRVNARDIGLNPKHWRQRISASAALALLPENRKNIAEFLKKREPQAKTYQALKDELIKLVENYGDEEVSAGIVFNVVAYPKRAYNDIPKLRTYFKLDEVEQQNRYTYDDALVSAVVNFQKDQGLKPDGIIGKRTLHALNRTNIDKIKQIIVNMERLRWVDDVKPNRFVVVNIPSATLWAVDNGKVRFEMPVIVGRKKRQTVSFVTNIHGVRFNPTWTVPPTIKFEDILPELQVDPSYLAGKGMELYDGYGRNAPTLDPFVIDWNSIGEDELHSLRMVQIPGKHNPLGAIRVLMPNQHNIYLHDTNSKAQFYRSDRAKSSGCIRMKDPRKIALFALENRKNWSEEAMDRILKKGETKDIYTSEKLAVYLLYYTAWLGDRGQVVYGIDIYDKDNVLYAALGGFDKVNIIGDNGDRLVQLMD